MLKRSILILSVLTLIFWPNYQAWADINIGNVLVGGQPSDLAINEQTNKIYVATGSANNVAVIDGVTHVVTLIPTGSDALAIAVNPVTNKIYVANYLGGSVTVIDGVNNSTSTILVGPRPADIAVNSSTNKIYVLNESASLTSPGAVTVIDGGTNLITNIPISIAPTVLAINTVTNKIYVAYASGGGEIVTVIDGSTNIKSSIRTEAQQSYDIAVNLITNKVYLPSAGFDGIAVIDGATNLASFIGTGFLSQAIAINPSSNKIYAVNSQSNNLTIVNGATNSVVTSATGIYPVAVAVNPVTNRIYVGKCGSQCGGFSQVINVYDGTSGALVLNVPAGDGQFKFAINSRNNRVYSANKGSGSVTVINSDDAMISGQVVTPNGMGLRNAVVSLTNSQGTRRATTSSFGIYSFAGLLTGSNYTIGVASRRYRFAAKSMQINGDLQNIDFIGLE